MTISLNSPNSLAAFAVKGYTSALSTHFPDHVRRVAEQVVLLNNGMIMTLGIPSQVMSGENLG